VKRALISSLALVAATLAAPVGARADTADDTFVAYAQSVGVSASRAALIKVGHDVCGLIAQAPAGDRSTSGTALANVVMLDVPSVTDMRDAADLAGAAVATYCPPG